MSSFRSTPSLLRGFSLIELLMILALLGVLLAIALPAFSSYQNRVKTAKAVQDVGSMSALVERYWTDNRIYPSSLADIGQASMMDPWGHPYVYYNVAENGKGGARKDHALNPLNTDFDLYSKGADGASKPQITQKSSLDDIIRASNGAYVGLASGF